MDRGSALLSLRESSVLTRISVAARKTIVADAASSIDVTEHTGRR
jgi:hypothetical protein